LVDGRLILVWYKDRQIHIWDTNKNEPLWTVDNLPTELEGLRISGDGTRVFCLTKTSIQAWSIDTGEHVGEVELELGEDWYLDPLQMNSSRLWIRLEDLSTQGWDFGTPSSSLAPSSIGSTETSPRLHWWCLLAD
jgi:WD40 repeat protein